jgi:hypothetical protein
MGKCDPKDGTTAPQGQGGIGTGRGNNKSTIQPINDN